ncbi:MAG: lipoprotein-releasing ABC transporter permease subunit [Ancalomicrobiaceae bacterium]|nr:lipoprotein-releasing ABC transporter permease subunit [Ancalomicrobiaceae bacterium]
MGNEAAEPTGTPPFARIEWLIGWRYLKSRRREAFISVIAWTSFLGIMIGVAALIAVLAVLNGFRTELLGKFLGLNGHILVQPTSTPFTDFKEVQERFAKVPGVNYSIAFIDGQALASGPSGASGALVRGMSGDDLSHVELVATNVKQGSLANFDATDGVAVGSRLAQSLGLRLGDPITIVTARGNVTPFGVTPRTRSFPIKAIFEVGMFTYDSSFVYMPLAAAQAFFNQDDRVTAAEIFVTDPENVDAMKPLIIAAAERPVYVSDWRVRDSTFVAALEIQRNVVSMIVALIVIVAAFNIIAGLTMLVKDKSRAIAILRTMGATRGSVMRIFLIVGMAIGIAGTLAGLGVGLLLCYYIEEVRQFLSWVFNTRLYPPEMFFLAKMRADVHIDETCYSVIMALVLSFLATIYPAWKAAKLDPVDALRYE